MMRKHVVGVLLLVLLSITFSSAAYAEHLFGPDPLDTTYGAYFRLRQEIWENVFDVDTLNTPNRNFFRLKTSLWTKLDYDKRLGMFIKLTNEAKYYLPVSSFRPTPNSRFDEDELVIDNLYVDAKNLFGAPVDLRIGRQDFIGTFGEGFLIMDGTPNDGSRTFYFNAARANVKFNENHNVDLVYITDPKTDIYLPSAFAVTKKQLTTSNEQGFVLYGHDKITDNISVEPYYIFKNENSFLPRGSKTLTPELDLHTFGARAVVKIDSWKVRGEFAYQSGDYDGGRDRTGYGGYFFVGRKYDNVALKPEFDLGYIYLSGDKAGTAKNETWDPLFSQWPIWSELYIFTFINENNGNSLVPAYWTNLEMIRTNVKLNFTPSTSLSLWYNYLWAPQKTQGLNPAMFSNDKHERGHLPQIQLSHAFSKKVDGYVLTEYFIPGNFYNSNADNALFFRWQLQIKI